MNIRKKQVEIIKKNGKKNKKDQSGTDIRL